MYVIFNGANERGMFFFSFRLLGSVYYVSSYDLSGVFYFGTSKTDGSFHSARFLRITRAAFRHIVVTRHFFVTFLISKKVEV